mgnify:CR=1 FL=1
MLRQGKKQGNDSYPGERALSSVLPIMGIFFTLLFFQIYESEVLKTVLEIKELPSPIPGSKAFMFGKCSVLVGKERGRWHLSIAHPQRLPTWEEVRDARYNFTPENVTMVMILPHPEQYVNIHPNCFHLWETKDSVPGEWG